VCSSTNRNASAVRQGCATELLLRCPRVKTQKGTSTWVLSVLRLLPWVRAFLFLRSPRGSCLNALPSLAVLRAGNLTGSVPLHVISECVNMAETQRANIMRKLKVHSLSGLMRYTIKSSKLEAATESDLTPQTCHFKESFRKGKGKRDYFGRPGVSCPLSKV
jgi:hypothetical protein